MRSRSEPSRTSVQTLRKGKQAMVRPLRGRLNARALADGKASITTPPTRKRQKKADSRVAELERKIDALTATLHAQKSGGPGDNRPYSTPPQLQGDQRSYRGGTESHEWGLPNRLSEPSMDYVSSGAPNRSPNNKRRRIEEENSHTVSCFQRIGLWLSLRLLELIGSSRPYRKIWMICTKIWLKTQIRTPTTPTVER